MQMTALAYSNISLHILCFIVSLIILIGCLTAENRKDRLNRLLMLFITSNMILLAANTVKIVFIGVTQPGVYVLLRVLLFIIFCFGPLLLALYTGYLVTILKNKAALAKKVRIAAYFAYAACAADIVLTVISQFAPVYYYIDEHNRYHTAAWVWVSDVCSILCMALTAGIVFYYRKTLSKREMVSLLSYIILPLLLMPVNAMYLDLDPVVISITLVALIFYVGIQSEQGRQLKEKELALTNARVNLMLTQIQPHFIYNTLATIEAFCYKDSQTAAKMVRDFSNYLRENMDCLTQKDLVSFHRELAHVKIYLDIEKQRFKERLTVRYDLPVTDFLLPALTLQPLVENAVRYGISKKRLGGTITLRTALLPEGIQIVIADDSAGFDTAHPNPKDGRSHIGIENVRQRLLSQCGGSLSVESSEEGVICTLIVPQRTSRPARTPRPARTLR